MRLLLAAFAAFFMLAIPAIAQAVDAVVPPASTVVQVPVGSWIGDIVTVWGAAIVSYVVYALRGALSNLGPRVSSILLTMQADQLMNRALVYAVNAVVGATKDKVWSIDVRNQVLKEVVTFALVHGSEAVKAFMGAPADIAEMGFSRIDTPAVSGDTAPKPSVLPDAPKPDFEAIGQAAETAVAIKEIKTI
ncbi:MAG TPA: hypothetical protein VK652_16835 [Steroidobacteraceae bacterium]|nr:hypothetical protein [Steroidobacteraceae bacterium]